ncbi:hypothetical protein OROHE_010238 [Orobanche hederae]
MKFPAATFKGLLDLLTYKIATLHVYDNSFPEVFWPKLRGSKTANSANPDFAKSTNSAKRANSAETNSRKSNNSDTKSANPENDMKDSADSYSKDVGDSYSKGAADSDRKKQSSTCN